MSLYQNILQQAQGVAGTPYQPYGGQLVAPVNQQQGAGIANINSYQPAFGTGLGMAYNAAQPITGTQISQYESPYTQQVVNATEAQFNNQNAQQQQGLLGSAVAAGALGGNRVGVAQGELANQQQLAQAPVIANLENQGYMTGLNTALTEQQALAQGAYGVANMAQAGLTGANAQIGAGTLQQQTQQAMDTAQYQQYLNALGYPFQTTQWLAGIGTGVGSQMGGTTTGTGTTTGPAPSMLGQLTSGAIGGLGLLGQMGAFAALNRGGGVNGYADGGGVAGPGSPSIPEDNETLHAQQRQLISGDRHIQMFPHDTPELPLPSGIKRIESHSGVFHYNPKHVNAADIHRHSQNGHEHVLLGLGPYSKHEILSRIANGEHPIAIVERNEHGHEVRAALGTHTTAHIQHQHMLRGKSRNHTIHVEHPHKVLSERMGGGVNRQSGGGVSNYPLFAGGYGQPIMPYSGGMSYIPGMGIVHGPGAPSSSGQAPPTPAQFQKMMQEGQQPSPLNQQNMQGLSDLAKGVKNWWNTPSPQQWSQSGADVNQIGPGTSDAGNVSAMDEAGMEGVDWEAATGADLSAAATDTGLAAADLGTDVGLAAADAGASAGAAADLLPLLLLAKRGGRIPRRPNGIANYDSGGNVEPLPMSLDQMTSALERLKNAGMLNKPAATDFAAARLKRLGISPKPYTGQDAPYRSGGVANYQDGGSPEDITPYQVASLEPGDIGPTGVSGGVPMVTGGQLDQHVLQDVPLPTPRPTIEPSQSIPGEPGVGVAGALQGAVPTPRSVPRGVRNNNPGNIEDGPFARNQPGYVGSDGRFAQFDSMASGQAATGALLGSYGSKGINTISGIVNRWAPAADNNDTNAYIRAVSKATGYSPDQPLDMKDPTTLNKVADAIHAHENGLPGGMLPNYMAGDYQRAYGAMDVPPSSQAASAQERLPATSTPTQATGVANRWGPDNPLWESMIAAGAAGLASRSPFAGVAIGEALGAGLTNYQQQRQIATGERLSGAKVDIEANRLSQQADQFQKNYELRQQQLSQQQEYQRAQIIQKGMEPKPFYNPNTGQMDYVVRTPEGDVVSIGTGQVLAGPHKGQMAPTPQSAPGQPGTQQQPGFQQAVFHPDKDGTYRVNNQVLENGQPYNYANTQDLPPIDRGMQLPEPQPVNGHSGDAIKLEAQRYFETGKLPTVPRGNSPVAIGEQNYQHAVQNYAAAQARSLGLNEQQMIDFWRKAPLAAKYATSSDGRMVVSMGVAIDHLDTLQQYYDLMSKQQGALAPGDIQTLNSLKAKIAKEFGASAIVGLNTAAQIVGPEIAKAIVPGGGGVTERTGLEQLWSAVNSPEQFRTAYEATQRLLAGQLGGRERQATSLGVRPEEFKGLIGDHAYSVLDQVRQAHNAGTTTGTGGATTPPAQQPVTRTYQGTTYDLKPGGNPKNQGDWMPRPPQSQ